VPGPGFYQKTFWLDAGVEHKAWHLRTLNMKACPSLIFRVHSPTEQTSFVLIHGKCRLSRPHKNNKALNRSITAIQGSIKDGAEGEIRTRTTVGHYPLKIAQPQNNQLVKLVKRIFGRTNIAAPSSFWLYPKQSTL